MQRKFRLSGPSDELERDADRAANAVVAGRDVPELSQVAVPDEGQRDSNRLGRPDSLSLVDQAIGSAGQPLDFATRAEMEGRFGHDFSRVRIHHDARAAESAVAVNAHAYTVGHDIVFESGKYAPATTDGRRLLAHELTHVAQQEGGHAHLARKANPHDGQPTRCGRGVLGMLEFEGPVDVLGEMRAKHHTDTIIVASLPGIVGGRWVTGTRTPPNQVKGGKERGVLDGLKVQLGAMFTGDVVEVKARSKAGGGGKRATLEAKEYVKDLNVIAPRLLAVSRAAHEVGGLSGKFPKSERDALKKQGVDLGVPSDAQAYTFYFSVQKKLPELPKRDYSGFSFSLAAEGTYGKTYQAMSAPTECQKRGKKRLGIAYLEFQLNQQGGASYGCRRVCKDEEDERKKKAKAAASAETETSGVSHRLGIDPVFHQVLRESNLGDEIKPAPDQIVAMTLARPVYEGILDALAFERTLATVLQNQPQFRGSALQQGILTSTIISAATAAGLAAAITISVAAPALGASAAVGGAAEAATAVGGTGEAATAVAGATETAVAVETATAAVSAAELTALSLSNVAANTNAVAIAAGVALFIGYKLRTESGAKAAIEAAFSNKEFMSVFDAETSPVAIQPGTRVMVNGQPHRVVLVGRG